MSDASSEGQIRTRETDVIADSSTAAASSRARNFSREKFSARAFFD